MSLLRILAMLFAVGLVALEYFSAGGVVSRLAASAGSLEQRDLLLQGALAFFLFAGALQVRFDGGPWLRARLVLLPLLTTGISVLVVAVLANWVLGRIGVDLPMVYCLLLGALAAPADPLAITRLMRLAGATPLQAGRVANEALWSSVFALLLFFAIFTGITIEGVMTNEGVPLVARQAGAGIVLGFIAGAIMIAVFRRSEHLVLLLALPLAAVAGMIALAGAGLISAPVAAACAGLSIAWCRDRWAVSEAVRTGLARYWGGLAEVLLALLLIRVGIELVTVTPSLMLVTSAMFLVPLVIFARLASTHLGIMLTSLSAEYSPEVVRLMVWGGVRSAVVIVLVLSLPRTEQSGLLLLVAFLLLAFSMLIQGPLYSLTAGIARPLEKERAQLALEKEQALEKEKEKQSANEG